MIIKKKYTTIKKTKEETSQQEEVLAAEQEKEEKEEQKIQEQEEFENKEEQIQEEPQEQNTPIEETQEENKENADDLDLTLDNIKFESREERREGTRRRGYRRTNDRNIVTRAQQDAISIKEAARKEGFEEGVKQAQQDIAVLRNTIAEFFTYKEVVYEKVSECIMAISIEIAKKIINKTVETDREYIVPLIKNALNEINKDENKITLKVMPKDTEIVKDRIEEIFKENSVEAKITVVPDNKIKEGGAIIETSNGIIDASIESQITIIEKALRKQEES